MEHRWTSGRVTSARPDEVTATTGDVDTNGELVGTLERNARRAINLARTSLAETGVVSPAVWELVDDTLDAYLGMAITRARYSERPGLDERIRQAGQDVDTLRRMLGVPR